MPEEVMNFTFTRSEEQTDVGEREQGEQTESWLITSAY